MQHSIRLLLLLASLCIGLYPIEELRTASGPVGSFAIGIALLVALAFQAPRETLKALRSMGVPVLCGIVLAVSYIVSTYVVAPQLGIEALYLEPVTILYIFMFVGALGLTPANFAALCVGVTGGVLIAVGVGTLRFFSGDGGIPSEHALGYWGIRYMPSTRNSDVLYPLFGYVVGLWVAVSGANWWSRLTGSAIALVCFLAVVYSYSRGAWLAVVAATAICTFGSLRVGRGSAVFAFWFGGAVCLLAMTAGMMADLLGADVFNNLLSRLQSIWNPAADENSSNDIRFEIISATLMGAVDFPLGGGAGNFRYVIRDTELGNAENAPLTILGEAGFVGFAAFVWLSVWLLARSRIIIWGKGVVTATVVKRVSISAMLSTSLLIYFQLNHELNGLVGWVFMLVACKAVTSGRIGGAVL